jgi:hypothetical protein
MGFPTEPGGFSPAEGNAPQEPMYSAGTVGNYGLH